MFQESETLSIAKSKFLHAAHRGNLTLVRSILSQNKQSLEAILLAKDPHLFSTGFHFACQKGYLDLLLFFLQIRNRDLLFSKDKLGRCGLHRAILSGQLDICQLILWRLMPEFSNLLLQKDNDQNDAVHLASMKGDLSIFKQILKAIKLCERVGILKFNFDKFNALGFTPLHIACLKKFAKIESLLLNVGAKVAVNSLKHDQSPLMLACQAGNLESTKNLINNFASINYQQKQGKKKNALMFAIESGNQELIEYLLQKGADVLSKDSIENTPLHYAGIVGVPRGARAIINHGGKPYALNLLNQVPYQLTKDPLTKEELLVCKKCRSKELSTQCKFCLVVFYCTPKCGRLDWEYHKNVCHIYQHLLYKPEGIAEQPSPVPLPAPMPDSMKLTAKKLFFCEQSPSPIKPPFKH